TQQQSTQAIAFLKSQLNQYKDQLNSAEQELAAFKKGHIGSMPNHGRDYYSQLQDTKSTLAQLRNELGIVLTKRAELRRQTTNITQGNQSPALNPRVQSINAQLQADQKQLNILLLKYTDQHPDVISLKAQISRLKKERS